MENMKTLLVRCEQLAGRLDTVACLCLPEVPNVGLHGVVAVTGGDIVEVGSNETQQGVGRFT